MKQNGKCIWQGRKRDKIWLLCEWRVKRKGSSRMVLLVAVNQVRLQEQNLDWKQFKLEHTMMLLEVVKR